MWAYLILSGATIALARGRDARVIACLLAASCALTNAAYYPAISPAIIAERFGIDITSTAIWSAFDAMTGTYVASLYAIRPSWWKLAIVYLLIGQCALHILYDTGMAFAVYSALLDASFLAQLACVLWTGRGALNECRDWFLYRSRHDRDGVRSSCSTSQSKAQE